MRKTVALARKNWSLTWFDVIFWFHFFCHDKNTTASTSPYADFSYRIVLQLVAQRHGHFCFIFSSTIGLRTRKTQSDARFNFNVFHSVDEILFLLTVSTHRNKVFPLNYGPSEWSSHFGRSLLSPPINCDCPLQRVQECCVLWMNQEWSCGQFFFSVYPSNLLNHWNLLRRYEAILIRNFFLLNIRVDQRFSSNRSSGHRLNTTTLQHRYIRWN